MRKFAIASLITALGLSTGSLFGAVFQASLTPDTAIQPRTEYISGVSLNIWGENPQSGFALGIINGATGDSVGFSLALFHNYADIYTGAQAALFNEVNTITGAQLGFVNYARVQVTGAQVGFLNLNDGNIEGAQVGFVNHTGKKVTGAQVGLVNHTHELEGVQLGLINWVESSGWFNEFPNKLAKGFVFVNWAF